MTVVIQKQNNCYTMHIYPLNSRQRKQMQHEIKVYMEKYFKGKLGQAADLFKVIIWHDMVIIRAEKILSDSEKYIAETARGRRWLEQVEWR